MEQKEQISYLPAEITLGKQIIYLCELLLTDKLVKNSRMSAMVPKRKS